MLFKQTEYLYDNQGWMHFEGGLSRMVRVDAKLPIVLRGRMQVHCTTNLQHCEVFDKVIARRWR